MGRPLGSLRIWRSQCISVKDPKRFHYEPVICISSFSAHFNSGPLFAGNSPCSSGLQTWPRPASRAGAAHPHPTLTPAQQLRHTSEPHSPISGCGRKPDDLEKIHMQTPYKVALPGISFCSHQHSNKMMSKWLMFFKDPLNM